MPSQSLIDAVSSPIEPAVYPWWTSSSSPLVFTFQMTDPGAPGAANLRAESGYSSFFAFNETQKQAVRSVLAEVSQLINVDFQEVTGAADPDFNFGRVSFPRPGQGGEGGFWYSYDIDQNGNPTGKTWDGYALWDNDWVFASQGGRNLLLHEIGHALALKHPGDYDVTGASTPGPFLPPEYESNKYTVMSYTNNPDNGFRSDHYMPFDILALQQMWGANLTHRTGDDVYTGPRDGRIDTIWDAGGRDAIDGSAQTGSVSIDLNEGAFSSLGDTDNLAIAYHVVIENATGGSADDSLVGNAAANRLSGGAGNDFLFGDAGGDSILGDDGNDYVDGYLDNDFLVGGGGHDLITAGDGDDFLAGQDGDDSLFGWLGNDVLYGDDGNDWLFGNEGNDLIIGNDGSDNLIGDGGSDRFIFAMAGDSRNGAADRIHDFFTGNASYASDIVDVSGVDANVDQAGDQAFQFVGLQNGPSGIGTLQVGIIHGVGVFLFGYTNADGAADLIIDIGLAGFGMRADNFWL